MNLINLKKEICDKGKKKVLFFIAFAALMFCGSMQAQQKNVTLSVNGESLQSVLDRIESQTMYRFTYKNDVLPVGENITFTVKDKPIDAFLNQLLTPASLTYKREGNTFAILPAQAEKTVLITGTVTDKNDEPVVGANIREKGAANGTITDVEGKFSLSVKYGAVIQISYIGYTTQEIATGNQKHLEIFLVEDMNILDEIIAIGYGTQKKANLTGAVSSIKTQELSKMGVTGISTALQGRAAGVQVVNSSGDPRSEGSVIIRGVGNIRGMGPLYVIDGVPSIGETGFNLNLKDISDIQILRDASSSAIYGARAAGGVILITTKRGAQKEKVIVNASVSAGVRNATFLPDLLNVSDYKRAWAEINSSANTWSEDINTDWVNYLYKTGVEQDYNASAHGGGEKSNYYVSGGYRRVDGVIVNSWLDRYSFRFNGDYQLGKMVKAGHSMNFYAYAENPPSISGGDMALPFRSTPMMKIKDDDGEWGKAPSTGNYAGTNWATGVNVVDRRYNKYSAEGNVYIDIEPFKDLHIKATGGGYYSASMRRTFEPKWFISGQINNQSDRLSKYSILRVQNVGNIVASYQKKFGLHEIKALAGMEGRKTKNDELDGTVSAILSQYTGAAVPDAFPVSWAESSAISNIPSYAGRSTDIRYSISRMMSYFGRINYTYADKYLFEANIRQDVSDRFAPKYRKGVFPSIAAGWRVSEENFLKDRTEALSNLKLRISYGSLGNDNVGSYAYLPSLANYERTQFNELSGTGAVNGWGISKVANAAIHWETVVTGNVGLDAGLFKNSLNLTVDYYIRNTKDMLYSRNFAFSTGMAGGHRSGNTYSTDMNLGEMRNKGLEITLDYSDKIGNVAVNVGANAAFNRNKMVSFGGETLPIDDGLAGGYWTGAVCRTELGKPVSQFYGLKTNGLIPDQATIDRLNAQAQSAGYAYWYTKDTGPGDIWYMDTNGDNTVNDNDRTIIGNPLPKMSYGFNVGAGYRNFDLSLFFSGLYGNDVFNGVNGLYNSVYNDYNTTADVFKSSFMYGNGLTKQPRWGFRDGNAFIYDPNQNYRKISDFHVENGSFLRLQSLQFGYTFPAKILRRIGLSNLRLYYSGQNLFVLSKVNHADPEVGFITDNDGPLRQGIITVNMYPKTRNHLFGIEISF